MRKLHQTRHGVYYGSSVQRNDDFVNVELRPITIAGKKKSISLPKVFLLSQIKMGHCWATYATVYFIAIWMRLGQLGRNNASVYQMLYAGMITSPRYKLAIPE